MDRGQRNEENKEIDVYKRQIPEGVTTIPSSAFRNATYLEEVNIPITVTEIGYASFSGCTGLKSIELPEGLTTINGSAFSGCSGLRSIELPDSVETKMCIRDRCKTADLDEVYRKIGGLNE